MREYSTLDELWVEYEKAIKFGHFEKFKTKRGMVGHLNRLLKKPKGKFLAFTFSPSPWKYKRLYIKVPASMRFEL